MITHYRDHFFYLLLISFLSYVGMYFVDTYLPVDGADYFLYKLCSHAFLTFNAFLIYYGMRHFKVQGFSALIVSGLYIVSPIHFDTFIFPFQLQALLAEFFLLIFFLIYFIKYSRQSLIALLLAVLLNSKLIPVLPFLWWSKKLQMREKIFCLVVFCYFLVLLFPLFYEQRNDLFNNIKTIFYMLEIALIPLNLNFMNFSVILVDYFSILTMLVLSGILFGPSVYLFIAKKNEQAKKMYFLFFVGLFGSLVPFKPIIPLDGHEYYFMPTFYPTILYIVLFLCCFLLQKFNTRFYSTLVGVLGVTWLILNINFQSHSLSLTSSWDQVMAFFPRHYNFEEKIKFKYASILILKKEFDKAEKFIDQAKIDFPNESWYGMLLTIASHRKDKAAADKIYGDLIKNKIPYVNPNEED